MIKNLSKSAGISLALVMAFFAQALLPVSAAYADNHAPAGNNGTVKINDEVFEDDPGNGNEPQLTTCEVIVRWHGFDEGERKSTVTFTSQAPTKKYQLKSPIGPQNATFTAPARENGNTQSNQKAYTLSFTGPAEARGYHVKIEVTTDGTQGKDTKYKVFWLPKSCGNDAQVITAPEPTFSPATCTDKATYTIPKSSEFTYNVTIGSDTTMNVDAGTYEIKVPAKVTISAFFHNVLWEDDGSPWVYMFDVPKCEGDQPGSGGVVTPPTPASPVVTSGTGSTVSELPTTGPGEMGALIALLAAVATYGAAYFAQPKRLYE